MENKSLKNGGGLDFESGPPPRNVLSLSLYLSFSFL
jgi:hypothetical protein